jgi:asparagine synthase (glutamine-hydrolysing)
LLEYLVTGYEEYKTGTFYQNIFKLQPGHNLVYDLQTHQFEINTYYEINLNHNVNGLTYDEAEKQFRDHFARSVRLRLRSDVKVGTCLSGGLDSSYLAAVAGKSYLEYSGKGFTAITARSTDYRKDESGYARMVAESAKLEWHIVTPGFDDFSGYLDEVITTQEEPFGSPSIFMQYFVMKEASKLGCKVMLDGQGGDETLLGYERNYAPVIRSQPLLNLPINFYRAASNSKLSARELLMYMFYFNSETIRINRLKQRCSFLKSEYLHIVDTGLISETCKVSSNIFELQKIEVKKSPLPALLKYEDRNSMKHSVEARLPFLDYQLLEFSLSLPTEMKMNQGWTKFILRKSAEKVLPSEIAWRKNKFGFEAPVHQWLGNNPDIKRKISGSALLRKYCSSVLFDMKDTSLLWRLYNIAKWEEVFNVSAD